ncbi:MAG: GNAT family N-acetyltransferase [Pseudomonadota bacterium]
MAKFILRSPKSDKEFEQYFYFRWQQLREPLKLPRGSEQDDLEDQAFHCMAIMPNQKIIGVGRINHELNNAMRIRYMAVDQTVQSKGVGSAILQKLIEYAKQKHAKTCWLNAREKACTFYLKQGFEIQDKIESDLNIPHFRMEKKI